MKALALVVLTALAMPALAKDTALTAAWSGIWADATGQHRCALQISGEGEKQRLVVLCQMGPDGVFADLLPMPAPGWQIFVDTPFADFGKPGAGHFRWGQISWHGLCDSSGPFIVANVYSPPTAVDMTLRPVSVPLVAGLCAPLPTWGSQ